MHSVYSAKPIWFNTPPVAAVTGGERDMFPAKLRFQGKILDTKEQAPK
jgi:hypothetical protein